MAPLTKEQFEARLDELIKQESDQPQQFWYLSWAGDDGFHGAAITKAPGFVTARTILSMLGVNPLGECRGVPFPEGVEPVEEKYRNRLLQLDELTAIFGEMKTMKQWEKEHEGK